MRPRDERPGRVQLLAMSIPGSRSDTGFKVFISYSRADLAFADELCAGLEIIGYEPSLDRTAIAEGEDWRARLGTLIAEAETVVFIISPDAARSEICSWEVEEAARLSKRIIPVLWRTPSPYPVPVRLAALNYVRFDPNEDGRPRSFTAGLRALDRALKADLDWLRAMSRWLLRAQEWDRGGRPANRLLTGSDIAEIKAWAARRPSAAPELTALHLDFIRASEAEEQARAAAARSQIQERERLVAAAEAAALSREKAVDRAARSQRRAGRLLLAIGVLLLAGIVAVLWQSRETSRREAAIFSALTTEAIREARYDRAIRFAVAGLPPVGGTFLTPWSQELEAKLAGAAQLNALRSVLPGVIQRHAFSPDGRRLISADGRAARIWDVQTGAERLKLGGHTGDVYAACFSRDGKRVATASADMTARVWDAATGAVLLTLKGHDAELVSVEFSADGTRMVTASTDATARIWDAATGAELLRVSGAGKPLTGASFNATSTLVLTTSQKDTVRVWDAATGSLLSALDASDGDQHYATFSPDGERIATSRYGSDTAHIWDARSGESVAALKGHTGWVWRPEFSPDGKYVVTPSNDGTVRIWDAATGAEVSRHTGHRYWVLRAAFSADGKRVASTSWDKKVRIWDPQTGALIMALEGHDREVHMAEFSPDGAWLATAAYPENAVRIWDLQQFDATRVLPHQGAVVAAAFDRGGTKVVTASLDRTAKIWDATTGTALATLRDHTSQIWSAAFNADGTRVLTGGLNTVALIFMTSQTSDPAYRSMWLWAAPSGALVAELKGHDGVVWKGRFSADGTRLVTASADRTARIWDARKGALQLVLRGHESGVNSAAFSPDGSQVVTASEDKTARIWDSLSGRQIAVLGVYEGEVRDAVYSPDGALILTTPKETGDATVWDARTAVRVAVLKGHESPLLSTAFSPSGKFVATGSSDYTARIWNARTGATVAILRGHDHNVMDVEFSPDETTIATASPQDGTLRLWDLRTATEIIALHRNALTATFGPDGSRILSASLGQNTAEVWHARWATQIRGAELRDRACRESLANAAGQTFSEEEMRNPILRGREDLRNPCQRHGPLSIGYWTRIPIRLWKEVNRGARDR